MVTSNETDAVRLFLMAASERVSSIRQILGMPVDDSVFLPATIPNNSGEFNDLSRTANIDAIRAGNYALWNLVLPVLDQTDTLVTEWKRKLEQGSAEFVNTSVAKIHEEVRSAIAELEVYVRLYTSMWFMVEFAGRLREMYLKLVHEADTS